MSKPLVAIVGRPNVGKSSFFNRLAGHQIAIVEDEPGTTRDRLYADAEWNGVEFTIIDTGGLETIADVPQEATPVEQTLHQISQHTRAQAELAIDEADVIVFMCDARSGLTVADEEIAEILRRSQKPVILVANKADNEERRQNAVEFYSLGLGDPLPMSTHHGINTGDLLDLVVEKLPKEPLVEHDENKIHIAIVGRPNVGKSRLLNALLGQDRVIVSDVPGTTRDAIDTQIVVGEKTITLIDTAGIRRAGHIDAGIERYSVIRAMRAIARADVVLLVTDASEGVTAQDTHIAGYILDQAKGVVVLVNKWDLIEKESTTMADYTTEMQEQLKFIPYAPLLFISAKFGQRVNKVMEIALQVAENRQKRVNTAHLNKLMREAVARHAPPTKPNKWLKFLYATQADTAPPTFIFFVNDAKQVHFSYKRYIENQLRDTFGFEGTPVRIFFRSREDKQD